MSKIPTTPQEIEAVRATLQPGEYLAYTDENGKHRIISRTEGIQVQLEQPEEIRAERNRRFEAGEPPLPSRPRLHFEPAITDEVLHGQLRGMLKDMDRTLKASGFERGLPQGVSIANDGSPALGLSATHGLVLLRTIDEAADWCEAQHPDVTRRQAEEMAVALMLGPKGEGRS